MLLASVLLVACGTDADDAQVDQAIDDSQALRFRAADGTRLAGRVFGPDDAAAGVVLAHGLPEDQSDWFVIADRLAAEGYRVITFNFRGYCPDGDAGCSEGERDIASTPDDVGAALAELRSQGVRRVALVGSSMGGTAALVTAAGEGDDVEAVITLSSPASIEALAAGPEVLERVRAATLFLAGTGDVTAAQAAEAFFNASAQPNRYALLTTADHGTAMLRGNQGEQTRTEMLSWLRVHLAEPPGEGP